LADWRNFVLALGLFLPFLGTPTVPFPFFSECLGFSPTFLWTGRTPRNGFSNPFQPLLYAFRSVFFGQVAGFSSCGIAFYVPSPVFLTFQGSFSCPYPCLTSICATTGTQHLQSSLLLRRFFSIFSARFCLFFRANSTMM